MPTGSVVFFLRDGNGQRPVYGGTEKFQNDPHWRDLILFYEYFHGDNGAGIGASHQTGWTGLVAKIIQLFGNMEADKNAGNGEQALCKAGEARKPVRNETMAETSPSSTKSTPGSGCMNSARNMQYADPRHVPEAGVGCHRRARL